MEVQLTNKGSSVYIGLSDGPITVILLYLTMDLKKAICIIASGEKKVKDLGDNLMITPPLIKDLLTGMQRNHSFLGNAIKKIEKDRNNEYSKELIETIRDLSGHLSLLCNMILNGKGYSEKEKQRAVTDNVFE